MGLTSLGRQRVPILVLALVPVLILAAHRSAAAGEPVKAPPPLAGSLPADILVYAQASVPELLGLGRQALTFIDPAGAAAVEQEIQSLFNVLKKSAVSRKADPAVLDHLARVKLHFVGLTPTTAGKARTPARPYDAALVLETSEQAAGQLLAQMKGLMEREARADPEFKGDPWEKLETRRGEMVRFTRGDPLVMGRLGRYLVLSEIKPTRLWNSLENPPEKSLADHPLFQRFTRRDPPSRGLLLLNVASLVGSIDKQLRFQLDRTRQEAAAGKGLAARLLPLIEMRQRSFQRIRDLFGLDRLHGVGLNLTAEISDRQLNLAPQLTLAHGKLPALSRALLNPGGSFQPPARARGDRHAWLLLRVDPTGILKAFADEMSAEEAAAFQQATEQQLKGIAGVGLAELTGKLAGDLYLRLGLKVAERTRAEWDIEAERYVSRKTRVTEPRLLLMLGLRDPADSARVLAAISERLSADRVGPGGLTRKTFQSTTVCQLGTAFGPLGDLDPDSDSYGSIAVVDRLLCLGSWEEVTGFIKQQPAEKSGPHPLAAAVKAHPGANLLAVIPRGFSTRLQQLVEEQPVAEREEALQRSLRQIGTLKLPGISNEKLKQQLRQSLQNLLKAADTLTRKAQELSPAGVIISGKPGEGFYEMQGEYRITRAAE